MATGSGQQRPIRKIETEWIALADGARLAATIWLPVDALERPVPAILEYLPYRRRDGTVLRDRQMHAWFAGRGYAAVRVDMRGSGDSDGILHDEYLPQEQLDAVEVIAWLAAQPWCSGTVGMIGISWGGFNGLQVAARRPPALKAVVTLCSTDDRYADDCHFMGGCLLNNTIAWGSTIFAFGAQPPDPLVVGERWRDMWLDRLENNRPWAAGWIEHSNRDDYWKQGSVREDYGAIEAAVYAVGGWADGYSNAIPRLMAGLKSPKKGLIGPWAHAYPQAAHPGPRIGFLQEACRWWDQWLKGVDTGIMDEPPLRIWMQESVPPATTYPERPGRWVAEESWPPRSVAPLALHLDDGRLTEAPPAQRTPMIVASPIATGTAFGEWCPYGLAGELPADQRPDDGRSVTFDTAPLGERLEILGGPVVRLDLSCDKRSGMVAVRLEDVGPDGASTHVTYGLLNLQHRNGFSQAEPLEPGRRYSVSVTMNDIAHAFPTGHRIRLAVATSHWPIAWPSPEMTSLTVHPEGSRLDLPVRRATPLDDALPAFEAPQEAAAEEHEILRSGGRNRTVSEDPMTGRTTVAVHRERASYRLPSIDLMFEADSEERYGVTDARPEETTAETRSVWSLTRTGWKIRTETTVSVSCTKEAYRLKATLAAFEGDDAVFRRDFDYTIDRET